MTISATVIADSISEKGDRLTTLQLRYPRYIHAEFMTHRQFSRNASSSRAIPVKRLVQDILDDALFPSYWGANQKGMQAGDEIDTPVVLYDPDDPEITHSCSREVAWDATRKFIIMVAEAYDKAGYHKQVVNRLLEPFSHINVVVTSSLWSNFFKLRRHPDAQPEMQELADAIFYEMEESSPVVRTSQDYHVPYVSEEERLDLRNNLDFIKVSVARCARVSYLTHDGKKPNVADDLKLYERLVSASIIHASPCEHQAWPDPKRLNKHLWGNLFGWVQYRKTLVGECW